MGGREDFPGGFPPWRVDSLAIAQPGRDPGLVQGDPERNRVTERLVNDPGVLGEPLARLPHGPSAAIFQRLRQVPVVERQHRFYGALPQALYELAVVVETLLVCETVPLRLYPGPGHGEAVGLQPEVGHEIEVFFEAVVLVAGDIAGVAVENLSGGVGEGVPDRGSAAVLVHGSLDLVGRCRRAPQEILGKIHLVSSSLAG